MARLRALTVILLTGIAAELAWLILREPPPMTERIVIEQPKFFRFSEKPRPTAAEQSEVEARDAINRIQRALAGAASASVPLSFKTPYAWQLVAEHFEATGWCLRWEKKTEREWTAVLKPKS